MRVTIRESSAASDVRALDALPPGTKTLDVPTGSLAGLTALFGIISGLTATGGLATFLWITQPDARQAREITADDARMKALTHAMQVESAIGRRTSIRLLEATGVLEPQNPAALATLLTDTTALPRWTPSTSSQGIQVRTGAANVAAADTTARTAQR